MVAITEPLANAIRPDTPSIVVRGAVDADSITRSPDRPTCVPFRLAYAGTLYDRYNLRAIVSALSLLESGTVEVHIYGRGPLEGWLKQVATAGSAIVVHGSLPVHELRDALEECDALLVLLDPADSLAQFSFPSKIFESMASGRIVLVSDLPTLDPRMREFLTVVTDLSPQGIAAQIEKVRHVTEAERRATRHAQLAYLRKFGTWSAVGDQLAALVQRLAAERPR